MADTKEGGSVSTVTPPRRPAYTPLDEPTTCMTPGHEDRPARCYPGGRLCEDCLPRTAGDSRNDEGDPR
jgi:hypothetical protein